MKRLFVLLIILLLGISAATAETTVLGYMPDDEYIHQYVAPNGQLLWFTAMEEKPHVVFEDVNFDGYADIVIFVSMGVSNFFTEFFVYDVQADIYCLATHSPIEYGICNYQLHPAAGLVESQVSNGAAGALHDKCLFRWEGNHLKLVRRAVSEEKTDSAFHDAGFTMTQWNNILHITVRDYLAGEAGGSIIFEETIALEDTEYRDIFTEESEALWQGLR